MAEPAWRRALKRAGNSRRLLRFAGWVSGGYMRFVRLTSTFVIEPADPFEVYGKGASFIIALWHGQQLMVVYLLGRGRRMRGLVSRSNDGELSAAYLGSFGMEMVRGSGGRDRTRTVEKGGVRGFIALKKSLDEGVPIGMVADIPNTIRRRCGLGIVTLARASGRPVVPIGFATSRWIALNTWDRATIHLPFSRAACSVGAPITVPRDADDMLMEQKRLEIENSLNAVTDRAYALVGKQRNWLD
ncbi:MAG TPA: lysophospholipid acyltransferase family protein [Bauldia sp.]|nr:lysophospholipid acyltransferase family protein [Bauldia sp.]